MMLFWRPRRNCLTNSLSFPIPCFWWGRGFEPVLQPSSRLSGSCSQPFEWTYSFEINLLKFFVL